MLKQVKAIKCMFVVAQVGLGYYDAAGNLIGEGVFPQAEGGASVAKLYHPHAAELTSLIERCVERAWAMLRAEGQAVGGVPGQDGAGASAVEGSRPEPEAPPVDEAA